jgi:hypothetical protein
MRETHPVTGAVPLLKRGFNTKLITILFDGIGWLILFNFTLTLTLSLKGEGSFCCFSPSKAREIFLFFPLPDGERIKVRGS